MDSGQQSLNEAKSLFILGPDLPVSSDVLTLYWDHPGALLLSGEDLKDLYSKLTGRGLYLGSNTRIDIFGHGGFQDNQHNIKLEKNVILNTSSVLKELRKVVNNFEDGNLGIYVHLWSCYSHYANNTIYDLPNSWLVTHSGPRAAASDNINFQMFSSIQTFFNNMEISPVEQFCFDIPNNNDYMYLSQNDNGICKTSHVFRNKYNKDIQSIIKKINTASNVEEFVNNYIHENAKKIVDTHLNSAKGFPLTLTKLDPTSAKKYLLNMFNSIASKEISNQILENFITAIENKGINIQDSESDISPLVYASIYNNAKLAEILLNRGANPFSSYNNLNCFQFAASLNNQETLEVLIQNIQDPIIEADALSYAAANGCIDIVLFLLKDGSKDIINLQDEDGRTPLYYASKQGHLKIVETLLKHDPDINIKTIDGLTALDVAKQFNHTEIINSIEKYIEQQQKSIPSKSRFTELVKKFSQEDKNSYIERVKSQKSKATLER